MIESDGPKFDQFQEGLYPMTFEEAAFKARNFAVAQGYSDLFLESEGGELGEDGRWRMGFLHNMTGRQFRLEVTIDNPTGQVVGLKKLER